MKIDAVSELDRKRDRTDEDEFRDRMDQADNNSRMELHISSVVGTKFSTPWKGGGGGGGGGERERAYAVY